MRRRAIITLQAVALVLVLVFWLGLSAEKHWINLRGFNKSHNLSPHDSVHVAAVL